MTTVYDWVSVTIFAGCIVLFMQRSVTGDESGDQLWHYIIASAGCAVANYLGNNGNTLIAIAVFGATLAFIWCRLRPFDKTGG